MTVAALKLQSWFDISIQYTGTAANAYAIAFLNGERSITDLIDSGEQIFIPEQLLVSKKEVQYLVSKKAVPATGISLADFEEINPQLGIGSMIIETNFIVQ